MDATIVILICGFVLIATGIAGIEQRLKELVEVLKRDKIDFTVRSQHEQVFADGIVHPSMMANSLIPKVEGNPHNHPASGCISSGCLASGSFGMTHIISSGLVSGTIKPPPPLSGSPIPFVDQKTL